MLTLNNLLWDYNISAFFYAWGDFLPATAVSCVEEKKNGDGICEWTIGDFGETGDKDAEQAITRAVRAYLPDEESLTEKLSLRAIEDEAGWYQSELVALRDDKNRPFSIRLFVRILPHH